MKGVSDTEKLAQVSTGECDPFGLHNNRDYYIDFVN
jgi:hypothetical protein